MATNTPNVNLKKPEDADSADLKVFVGENMDIIDSELAKKVEKDGTTGLIKPVDLPIATPTTLGGIKVGTGLSIDANGALQATGGGSGGSATEVFQTYTNASQPFTAGAWTKVKYNGLSIHIGGGYDIMTDKYVVPTTGTYLLSSGIAFVNGTANMRTVLAIYKNGYSFGWIADSTSGGSGQMMITGSQIAQLEAGDTLEIYAYTSGNAGTNYVSGNILTYFFGTRL
jgi:hypothetical protein